VADKSLGDLDRIKRVAIAAMFADDWLMDQLVLKGGNAMDIVLRVHSRASVDLDFSLAKDLDLEQASPRIKRALENTFRSEMDYLVFDIKMIQKPKSEMPDELAAFWGGYEVEFKLIARMRAGELGHDLQRMRREAIKLGQGPKFSIDISRHEYVEGKEARELLGYRIFVYSPSMIVGEKVRAICQQMPEYAAIIQRQGLGNQRARDFVDIEALVKMFRVDVASKEVQDLVRHMFEAKRVPLSLIGRIADGDVRDLHSLGFTSVRDTMRAGVKLEDFDHYHRFVVDECRKLEPLWNV
jgi:hypothetical protein